MTKERKKTEYLSSSGKLLIFTGRSGAGKDWIVDNFISRYPNFTRVVTNAARNRRPGEIDGEDYHFTPYEDFLMMVKNKLFAEDYVQTGGPTDLKATSKEELYRVFNGENKIWRIDLSLAEKIANGEYFHKYHDSQYAQLLQQNSKLIYVHVDEEIIIKRRMERDGDNYHPDKYKERDIQELPIVNRSFNRFEHKIHNFGTEDEIMDSLNMILKDFVNF